MKPILIGLLGALFFSFAFVFNRSMELAGGSWIWSSSLRYYFMLIILLFLVRGKKNVKPVLQHIKKAQEHWIIWSTFKFGTYYAKLTYATINAHGGLVAERYQLDIDADKIIDTVMNKDNKNV